MAAGTDSRRSQRLSPHRRRKRKPPPVLASSPSCPVSPRLLRGTSPHHADARRSPQGAPPLLGVCVRTGDASAQGGLALGRGANAALGFPGPCLRPRKPTRPPETSHLHCAPAERPQVPAPRPLPRRGPRPALSGTAAGRTPALPALYAGLRVRRWPPCLLPGPPLPRPRGFLTRENTGRWTDAQRHRIPDWPQRQGKHDRQLPTSTAGPRPFLTCLHGIREVVPRGCCPGKLLQFPGAEVQPPGVGRFLQGALEPPVQGQVEDPAAAAAASPDPAAGPGSCVVLMVLVVGMMMWVQSSHREGRNERLGFASRRRHLLPHPPPQPRPAAPAGRGSQLSPGRGIRQLGREPAVLQAGCWKKRVWQARGVGGGRGGGSGSSVAKVSCPQEAKYCSRGGGRQRACVSSRPCSLLCVAHPSSAACSLLLLPPSCQPSRELSAAPAASLRAACQSRLWGAGRLHAGSLSFTRRTPLGFFLMPRVF